MNTAKPYTVRRALRTLLATAAALAVCVFFSACGGGKGKNDPSISVLDGYTITVTTDSGGSVSFDIDGQLLNNAKVVLPLAASPDDAYPEVPANTVLNVAGYQFRQRRMTLDCIISYEAPDEGLEGMVQHVEKVAVEFTIPKSVDISNAEPFEFSPESEATLTREPYAAGGPEAVPPMTYVITLVSGICES